MSFSVQARTDQNSSARGTTSTSHSLVMIHRHKKTYISTEKGVHSNHKHKYLSVFISDQITQQRVSTRMWSSSSNLIT